MEDFDLAYAGSPLLGSVLERHHGRVAAVAYGHLHGRGRAWAVRVGGVPYVEAFHGRGGFTVIEVEQGRDTVEARVILVG
ncbi:hypothetical protein [Pyrodictium abyssi]|uniref:hypothetical protein n=1 Tax=Pyrodictium abyssi TaxID=54256 RepID=UPI0030C6C755